MTFRCFALCAASVALLAACEEDRLDDAYYGRMVYDVFPDTARGASQDPSDPELGYRMFELKAGYVNGQIAEYADLGAFNPLLPNVYVLVHGGKPVAGQYPIVDTAPDKVEYSSMWHVVEVEVPGGYEVNSIKSLSGIRRNDFTETDTTRAMYCPIVNPDAAFYGVDGMQYTVFFGTGEEIPNPYFDPNADAGTETPTLTDEKATEGDIRLQPVWHKRLMGFCLPGQLDVQRAREYKAVKTNDDPKCQSDCAKHWELDESGFGARYDQYEPLIPGAEPSSWELPPIFAAEPEADAYSPVVVNYALYTDMPSEVATLEGFDLAAAGPLQYLDNPIFRTLPIPEPAPEGDAAAMQ